MILRIVVGLVVLVTSPVWVPLYLMGSCAYILGDGAVVVYQGLFKERTV